MDGAVYFSETYADARDRFCEAAERSPVLARRWSAPFEELDSAGAVLKGRNDERLTTDFAWFGALDAPSVLVLCSGTHGAEGLAGSGAQLAVIENVAEQIASQQLGVMMIHALNPWGCSHERRCDHEGVDVMRNFVDFDAPLPKTSPLVRSYISALAPDAVRGPSRWRADGQILWALVRYGLSRLQAEVPQGQYEFPHAPFYGGAHPTWSRRTLERELSAHVGRSRQAVAMIDVHTGLGARGKGVLLGEHDALDEPSCLRAFEWWGADYEPEAPERRPRRIEPKRKRRTAYRLNGSMPCAVRWKIFEDETLVYGVHEFGTISRIDAMDAVRDNHAVWNAALARGESKPDPNAEDVKLAHESMREAFYPSDGRWRAAVSDQVISAVRRAADGLLQSATKIAA